MQEEGKVKPEHLEILLKLNRQRVLTEREVSKAEIKSLEYWEGLGMAIKNKGRNYDDPMVEEIHWLILDKGEKYCFDYNRVFD
jgi:hypothetical protein